MAGVRPCVVTAFNATRSPSARLTRRLVDGMHARAVRLVASVGAVDAAKTPRRLASSDRRRRRGLTSSSSSPSPSPCLCESSRARGGLDRLRLPLRALRPFVESALACGASKAAAIDDVPTTLPIATADPARPDDTGVARLVTLTSLGRLRLFDLVTAGVLLRVSAAWHGADAEASPARALTELGFDARRPHRFQAALAEHSVPLRSSSSADAPIATRASAAIERKARCSGDCALARETERARRQADDAWPSCDPVFRACWATVVGRWRAELGANAYPAPDVERDAAVALDVALRASDRDLRALRPVAWECVCRAVDRALASAALRAARRERGGVAVPDA